MEIIHSKKKGCAEKKRVNYYPFGLKHKGYNNVVNGTEHKWKFNGKELEEELGLNSYDFGARSYMQDLGRWKSLDPHAENYFSISPNVSFANNPISFVDPDGRDLLFWQKNKKGKWEQVGFDQLDKDVQKGLEAFAKTKSGNAFLSKFAKKGDKIGEVEFTEDGEYSKHELSYGDKNYYGASGGSSYARHKKGDNKLTFEWTINSAYKSDFLEDGLDVVANYASTNGHEAFIHFSQYVDELIEAFDSGDMDKVNAIFRKRKEIAGDRGGGVEHDGYVNKKEEFKQMRSYVSQLKQVLNPSNVNKVMQRHDNKLKTQKKN